MELSQQFSPLVMPKRKPEPSASAPRTPETYSLHPHAAKQATMKGFSHSDVIAAANDPQTTYENGRYPGQMRHIRGKIVAVVEPSTRQIRTVYENIKETDLRADQKDRDAIRYGKRKG